MWKADLEGHVLSESSGLLSIAAQETAHHNSIAEKNREIVERAERLTAFHERVAHRVKLYVKTVNPYLQRGNPSKIERLLASKYNFFLWIAVCRRVQRLPMSSYDELIRMIS